MFKISKMAVRVFSTKRQSEVRGNLFFLPNSVYNAGSKKVLIQLLVLYLNRLLYK